MTLLGQGTIIVFFVFEEMKFCKPIYFVNLASGWTFGDFLSQDKKYYYETFYFIV